MTMVTQWFKYSKKPCHNGVYERAYGSSHNVGYAYWQDGEWFFRASTVEQAKRNMHAGMETFGGEWEWRGLAERAK